MTPGATTEPFDDLLVLIGRLTYVWTNTESLLIHLIAGLSRTDKETATVIFLTLNTTRARVDLVERLAKLDRTPDAERKRVLDLTHEFSKLAALRNHYAHSIYSFDEEKGEVRTIMMRIADRKQDIRVGKTRAIDAEAIAEIEDNIARIASLNMRFWGIIRAFSYPV
ncbi:hypothetical protein OB2597_13898 [Pseudooceanicola batsensis HTCC2597]|uniref:Cthe-2314-like HEPN domain-containing protein n=1 Tax=Pseudooceanicola batsensis (strain ATCC BAA-863 / DSM 15984 / KCTC 12145 / HTCC2597) TaxID=252305 RepID=A3TYK8_PSEBH|nr:hypothetical protein [Pseudooceanicola batsensis]EAQ03242.1 hypothetical protein OB2597_13898 [Pseudooceanicola batsensis HTCC2597]